MKSITIGRSSKCNIIVPQGSVSRIHAHISVNGGLYVYEDMSTHGSVVNGQLIKGCSIEVAPGTEILLAGQVPLPWRQIYSMLPLQGRNIPEPPTAGIGGGQQQYYDAPSHNWNKGIGIGWGLLAFIIPIAGWIMYFVWKDDTPRRAQQANGLAWAGFILNVISNIFIML